MECKRNKVLLGVMVTLKEHDRYGLRVVRPTLFGKGEI